MTKLANAYLRNGTVYVSPLSRTVVGLWIGSGPIAVVDSLGDAEAVASAIRAALDASRQGVPHPTDFDAVLRPLLDATGTRSWAGLVKGTKLCEVSEERDTVEIMPMAHRGGRGGFEDLTDNAITFEVSEFASIARYLAEAFVLCKQG